MTEPLRSSDPRQLGGYWLAGRLGAGGQGVVYEGYDAQGGRAAVKALHADAVTEALRHNLRKEASTLRRVASFCTARIIAYDLDHPPPYLVSEYVPGPDLEEWVAKNGAYGPDELLRLAIGIATALTSVHRADVIHRDMKPANVLLGPDGPRVIDFGIAKTAEMSRSATGQLKGTIRWMAPELFRGERATPAVDVWAWGAIVLFAATGKAPFEGGSLPVLMHRITTTRPDFGVLAEPLRGCVEAALNQDPRERPTPEKLLISLVGGQPADPLQAGEQAAAESAQPSMTLPPSLAERAEQVYSELEPHTQQAVPRILLRMVVARPNADDVLCTVPPSDFLGGETDQDTVQRVLNAFTEAELLQHTEDGDIRITTPALLRAWPRLRDWVEAERDGLSDHHTLADAARRWNAGGRKPTDLLQGSRLEEAQNWASTGRRQLTLNLAERDFLQASAGQARSRARTRTIVTAALAALLLVAVIGGSAAAVQTWNLSNAKATVVQQRDLAVGRRLADQALQIRRTDPALARRLAIAAASLAGETPATHNALLALSAQWETDIWTPPGTDDSWDTYATGGGSYALWKQDQKKIIVADPEVRKTHTITVTGAPVDGMDMSMDGTRLFVLQKDGTMTFWDVATGAHDTLPLKHPEDAGLTFGPTGAKMIRTLHDRLTVFESATGKELFRTEIEYPGYANAALSPDGRYLVVTEATNEAGGEQRLDWWDLTTGKKLDGDHTSPDVPLFAEGSPGFLSPTFSPDGRAFAAVVRRRGKQDRIVVMDARTRDIRNLLAVPHDVDVGDVDEVLEFTRDGRYITADMALWSTTGGVSPLMRYQADTTCSSTTIDRDGTVLRCSTRAGILSLDVSDFTHQKRFTTGRIDSAFSRDGTTLAVRTTADSVQIWDTATSKRRGTLAISPSPKLGMALSHDGRLLALTYRDGRVEIWDVRKRTKRTVIDAGPPPNGRLPSFSPDNKAVAVLVSTEPSTLKFWDTATGRLLGEARATNKPGVLPILNSSPPRIVWSEDGHRVISANNLGVVEFPSGRTLVPPGKLNASVPDRTVEALSPQGILATVEGVGDRHSLIFWDAATLKRKGRPIRLPESSTRLTALSPDGRLAATTDINGNIDIWDVQTQRHLGLSLTGHTSPSGTTKIQALAFSPDGKRVYSVGKDDAAIITHIVDPALLKEQLCKETGPLTRQQWEQYVGEETGVEYRATC